MHVSNVRLLCVMQVSYMQIYYGRRVNMLNVVEYVREEHIEVETQLVAGCNRKIGDIGTVQCSD